MEGSVEILLNHLENKEKCVNSVILRLASSLLSTKHVSSDCTYFRKKLETLNIVMKVECLSNRTKIPENGEYLRVIEEVVDKCIKILCGLADGKDLCIPVICDVLCSSLALLPPYLMNDKITIIMHNCKRFLMELVKSPSLMSEDLQNSSTEVVKLGINLRIWESVISLLTSWGNKSECAGEGNPNKDNISIFDDEFIELLLKIISYEHDILTSQILLCVIPKLVSLTKTNSVLEKLWNYITDLSSVSNGQKVTPHVFLIMCALSDYFIPCEQDISYSFPVSKNDEFWRLLQCGLASHDALMRKQALYLLKRAVERESTIPSLVCNKSKVVLFWWDQQNSQNFQKIWEELFLFLEVLEEKQMHLIEPVQPVISSLIKACQKSLIHSSWILCVIHRALRHESNAVVKWGILCFTELDINLYMVYNVNYADIVFSLVNALNSSSMYIMNSKNLLVPEVVRGLRSFFVSIADTDPECRKNFFRHLLKSIVEVSWGPVALFYVVFALAAVPKCPVWAAHNIQIMKNFLVEALATQVVHIRGAIQSFFIDILINLTDEQQLEVSAVAEMMGSFSKSEGLRRGSSSWHNVILWLKSFVSKACAFRYAQKSFDAVINDNLECEKLTAARMIILLSDADLICLDAFNSSGLYSLSNALLSLVEHFENCHERLYVCHAKQDSCLEMLIHLLKESQPIVENDLTGKYILSLIFKIIPGVFYCIKRYMFSAYNLESFDTSVMYLHSLNILSNEPKLQCNLLKHAEMLQSACFSIASLENATPMSEYFSIKVLSWISNLMNESYKTDEHYVKTSALFEKQMAFSENMLKRKNLNCILIKAQQDKQLTRDMQTLWGRLVAEYMQSTWFVLNFYIEMKTNSSELQMEFEFASYILTEAEEALEVGGRGMLIPVMSVMQQIAHLLVTSETREKVKRFIALCWTGIFELRKSELFWISMEKYVQMTFQKCLINDSEMSEILLQYARKIFIQGESVTGLCNKLLQQLQEVAKHYNLGIFQPFADILVDALLFGPVYRRDRKIDDETCAFIKSLGDKCCINDAYDICSDTEVRARAINLLLYCQDNETFSGVEITVKIVNILLLKDALASRQRSRYFADSYHHRLKNRIMQVLLLLEPLLPEEECEKLTTYLRSSVLTENHQPSVRYLQEWILIRLMIKNPKAHFLIWDVFQAAAETKPGSLCSFISIVYHIARMLPKDGLEEFIDKAIKEMLPCTMTQHFNVRLYAQVSLSKLWEYAEEKALSNVTEKYRIMYLGIMTCLRAPSSSKSVKKLEDFYFTAFHPLEHYSLQTIFYELPRLTNVTQDEWISPETLLSCGLKTTFPVFNKRTDLQDCEHLSSIVKSELLPDDDALCTEVANVQKKIIPWKAMVPDPEMLLSLSETIMRRKQMILEEGLIIVASLIDRPPNLGGLSRTCEAFGVCQYVIGNIKYLEDKQFQTLSVSAERWISIREIKPHDLALYLEDMKCRGYTIVGAEQTANSILLSKVKFPKRTLLLLGNEKEGIPVNLLPLLDMCVEVPQQGVIRSLNVHVTGAIFIWEYARQHNVKH
ncbi:Putative methyltransferase TARBP1 [Gryllus bimaculatus]|nr:Putative methyltransferase TARBP1 [Gryllus bimaculatus]